MSIIFIALASIIPLEKKYNTIPLVKASPKEKSAPQPNSTVEILSDAITNIENDTMLTDSDKKRIIDQITGNVQPNQSKSENIGFSLVNTKPAVKSAQEATEKPIVVFQAPKDKIADKTAEKSNEKFDIPNITITGSEEAIPVGEIVQLDVTLSEKPSNLYSVSYAWTVLPKKPVIIWPDGTRIIFGTGTENQIMTVILTVSFVYVVKDGDKITNVAQRSTTNTVSVQIKGGSQTTIPDNPNDLSDLTQQSFEWVKLVSRTDTYTNEDVKIDARKLANSFIEMTNIIDNKDYSKMSPEDIAADIVQSTTNNNNKSLDNRNQWLPWFNKMSEYLQTAYENKSISTPQQFSTAWKEIARGLIAASN